jgi:hypothetical protein
MLLKTYDKMSEEKRNNYKRVVATFNAKMEGKKEILKQV